MLPKLEGKQLEVLALQRSGHTVVLGTAGSGKTTLAIYRAAHLAKKSGDNKVLLLTFNKTLVKYINKLSGNILRNIDVHNYHKFARGYLNSRGKMPKINGIVRGHEKKLEIITEALDSIIKSNGGNSTLNRGPRFCMEEIDWIQKMGIASLEQYEKTERIGRVGTRLARDNRKYIYQVYEEYLKLREEEGFLYDWEDIGQYVYNELLEDKTERKYKHIIIDEGQDLSPVMLKSLAKAIPEDGSLTFLGDVAQQIYGSRISWRNAGLKLNAGDIWRFENNYRNSKEITKLAIAISESPYFVSEDDVVIPALPKASSPMPIVAEAKDYKHETEFIVRYVKGRIKESDTSKIAVLVKDRKSVETLVAELRSQGVNPQILHGEMPSMNIEALVSVGTFHSAKGLEFDLVLIPYCAKETFGTEADVEALGSLEDVLSQDIKLLYVAVTRAKRELIITYSGELTGLLPEENLGVYDKKRIK